MSKPTSIVDWARDSEAIKEETTAKQKTHGWTTSNDTITGTLPRPVIKNQNWWQDSVADYINFVGDNSADGLGSDGPIDLWEWDTVNLGQVDTKPAGALRFVDNILPIGNSTLSFSRLGSTALGNGDPWLEFQPETQLGGMFYEFQDMLSRGIGFNIVDGDGVKWTTFNPTGTIIDGTSAILNGNMLLGFPMSFEVFASSLNTAIRREENGVVTFPDNYSGFEPLDINNFADNNPNGVRAVLYGPQTYGITTAGISSQNRNVKRRWIRPGLISKVVKADNPNLQWPIAWEVGKSYRLDYHLSSTINVGQGSGIVYAEPVGGEAIHGYGRTEDYNGIAIHCEFMGPFGVSRKAISFSETSTLDDDGGNFQGEMDDMYNDVQFGNILTVEEI